MLKNSRVTGVVDVTRLAAAVRGPGLDSRTWVSLAVIDNVRVDQDEGVFADVMLMPLRRREVARVGQEYAGHGYGLHMPLQVGDEVLVEAPSGDPDEGLVVSRRLHSPSDPPPADVVAHPQDVVLVVRGGQSVRIVASDGGNVVLECRGDSQVRLGGDSAQLRVAREGDTISTDANGPVTQLQAMLDARYVVRPSPPPAALPPNAPIGVVTTGSDVVRAR